MEDCERIRQQVVRRRGKEAREFMRGGEVSGRQSLKIFGYFATIQRFWRYPQI